MQVLWFGRWKVDARTGPPSGIQRAFLPQLSISLGPLIEVGVCGLYAMAWELASGGSGVTTSASGFHRERGVLGLFVLEGGGIRMFCRGYGRNDDDREDCTGLNQGCSHRIQA